MFLRLLVADWFVHGLGGALYDVVTDALIEQYWKIAPPGFSAVSATFHVPIDSEYDAEQHDAIARLVRDTYWNPDRHLDELLREQEPISEWVEQKYALMEEHLPTHRQRRERFHRFRQIAGQLRPFVEQQRMQWQEQLTQWQRRQQDEVVASRRDYAFCLHPPSIPSELQSIWA